MKKIDIVIPLHNEERNIVPLFEEIKRVTNQITGYSFSLLFVDDGSKDGSFEQIQKLCKENPDVKIISFSRNFGKEVALTAGIRNSTGDALILMDADLQHPPKFIPALVKEWEQGAEVVVAVRTYDSPPPLVKRVGSYFFNKIIQWISETEIPNTGTDFRLLDKKVVKSLKTFTERNRLVRGLIDWLGFRRSTVNFNAPSRLHGEASYSFIKLLRLAMNSFTSFSLLPLKITGYMGIVFVTICGFLLMFMSYDRFTANVFQFTNLAFVVVVNTFCLGLVMIGLGLIALYVGPIYTESVNLPMYVVR